MYKKNQSAEDASFFNISHARWVIGVLSMLIAVVGKESLVGLLLRQTRREIDGLIQDEQPTPAIERAARYKDN